MISSIASAYHSAADHAEAERHLAWRLGWQRLRADWAAGQRPAPQGLDCYLTDVPPEDQRGATCDLISEHLRLAWQAGCGAQLEAYVAGLAAVLPWLSEPDGLPANLVEDEFVARSTPTYGDQPAVDEYAGRFPGRADVMQRLAGRCLAEERYIKLRVLGAGLLGVVHQAYDRIGRRLVAVKEAPGAGPDDDSSRLLLDEARLTAGLDHPSIVAVYDWGRSENAAFAVMAFLEGRTFAEHIREEFAERPVRPARENRRALGESIGYLISMCRAVAHAHQRGLLHRDIKPGNVIVGKPGDATIIDWGLARRLPADGTGSAVSAASPGENTIVGTPQYMAPEQAEQRAEAASDIFSLGAVLYEILTGRPPYDWPPGALPADWRATVCSARITPPRQAAPQTPRPLDAICTKALARQPADRYATAEHFADELRRYLESENKGSGWLSWMRRNR